MLILQPTSRNFSTLAASVVQSHLSGEGSLEDCIVKQADASDLCPEEVRRLVEKSNQATALQLLRTSENKKSVIKLATCEAVLARTHPRDDARETEKTASVYTAIPAPQKKAVALARAFGLSAEKTAAHRPATIQGRHATSGILAEHSAVDALKQKKMAMELRTQASITRLSERFVTQDAAVFSKFASEVMAVEGDAARPLLDHLAKYLRVPTIFAKHAGVVDDRTEAIRLAGGICSSLRELEKLGANIVQAEARLADAWRIAKGSRRGTC